jgi:hypothetical protein
MTVTVKFPSNVNLETIGLTYTICHVTLLFIAYPDYDFTGYTIKIETDSSLFSLDTFSYFYSFIGLFYVTGSASNKMDFSYEF